MKKQNPKVIELQNQIKRYDADIDDDIADGDTYQMKANALVELGKITGDASCNMKALECYNKAIELDPENPDYFAARSRLRVTLGDNEGAVKDIQKVKELPESSNPIAKMYLSNTLKEIAQLDAVQSTIKQLQAEGKIDPALAGALAEHAKVTANLVVQVGAHGERLDVHDLAIGSLDARTEELVRIVQALSEGRKVDEAQIERLVHDTVVLKTKVEENTAKIQGIELQTLKTEGRVEELSKKLETFHSTATELGQKIEANKKVSQKDKEKMQSMIKGIEKSITNLAKQDDIVKITAEMARMISEGEFTQDMLTDLQTQIDEMKGASVQTSTTALMLGEVVYDNLLLNHPGFFGCAVREFGLIKTLDLSARLDESLVDEAIRNSDATIILGGLLSVNYEHMGN